MFKRATIDKRKNYYFKSGLNSLDYKIVEIKKLHKHVDLIKIIF